jgi:hypothetical protein
MLLLLLLFIFFFSANQRLISHIFSSVAPHRGEHAAKCHLRWQPTRRLAVSCGLGDAGFEPGTTGQQSGALPMNHYASLCYYLMVFYNPPLTGVIVLYTAVPGYIIHLGCL